MQVPGQLMPGGTLVTVPPPSPTELTVKETGGGVKLALTCAPEFSVSWQVVPLQAPPNPLNW